MQEQMGRGIVGWPFEALLLSRRCQCKTLYWALFLGLSPHISLSKLYRSNNMALHGLTTVHVSGFFPALSLPAHTLFQPHGPTSSYANTSNMLSPQALGSCFFLCLNPLPPNVSTTSFLPFFGSLFPFSV